MKRILNLPYTEEAIEAIERGDEVIISGFIYVGRDQVHKRLYEAITEGKELPFDFTGSAIYYMGPSPAPTGFVIGACGPTTSARMDRFSPILLSKGLRVMIGKGPRSKEVIDAVKEYKGLYLQAYGGCGALYSSKVIKAEPVAYNELGPEALIRLEVKDFPAFCLIDSRGNTYCSKSIQ